MKVISLEASNVKRLRAVEIRPDPSNPLVLIKGSNGQGKTSVLDAITFALGGKDVQPPKVIRDGEEKAQVVVDLGDLVVTRRWTSNDKSYLDVKSKDGAKYGSPQAMLDKLVGTLSFDPLSFTRLDPKAQAETLRKLVGLDFTEIEARRKAAYDERTGVNRELTQAKSRLVAMPAPADAPDAEVSLADLLAEQETLSAEKAENDRLRREAEDLTRKARGTAQQAEQAQAEVTRLRAALAQAEKRAVDLGAQAQEEEAFAASVAAGVADLVDPDLSGVRERIRTVEQTNAAARAKKARAEVEERVRVLEQRAEACTATIASIDAEKAGQLAGAQFPVPGLSFGETGVTLNGIPLQQASAAEQLRVSLAMGLALNPKLKVLLIRDGSLLDDRSLAMVAQMAADAGAQVWLERVGDRDAMGVLIEDGQVAGADGLQAAAGGEA